MKTDLTEEQKIFYLCLKKLKALEQADPVDVDECNRIRLFLWDKIKLFARKEMHRMIGSCSTPDERQDVEQDMIVIFLEKLPYYNPLLSTPTTYFVRYFRERISAFLRENKVHMTQYDANNARKINAVIASYKKRGLPCTIDMISTKTGLSQRVIKSTIQHSANARRANIEEAYELHAPIPTPEEAFVIAENEDTLLKALYRNTDEEERTLLAMRVNAPGYKEMPYDQIAALTNRPIRDVKAKINRATRRMSQDVELCRQFGNHNMYKPQIKAIPIQDDATETMRVQLDLFIDQMPDIKDGNE